MTTATQTVDALNDARAWSSPSFNAPLSEDEIANVQKEIDSIVGLTRGNKSIAKLVWNGDVRHWKTVATGWNSANEVTGWKKRPIVLYRSVYGPNRTLIRDEFPPRWLILTRIEPEQYHDSWKRDAKIFDPVREAYIQIKPDEPPHDGWYVWFMTIAEHDGFCCRKAAEKTVSCYGKYADPRFALQELRNARKWIEETGAKDAPFDSPDRVTRKLRERSVNDYVQQSLKTFDEHAKAFIDVIPEMGDLKKYLIGAKNLVLDETEKEILRDARG